jgi:response regulator RpfG family c-di-GMP phosphodiesterase
MPLTILLVEDDPVVLHLMRRLLSTSSFSILTARDASAAKSHLHRHIVDAVITDNVMPGGSGIGLLDYVREVQHYAVRALITGAEADAKDIARCVDRFLEKPFDGIAFAGFMDDIVAEIGRRRAYREAKAKVRTDLKTFEELFHGSPLPMSISDLNGYVCEVNEAWVLAHGDSRDDALRQRPHILPAHWAQIREKGEWSGEIEVDGTYRRLTISVILNDDGEPYAYGAIERDVTDEKRLSQQKRAAQYELILTLARMAEFRDPETGAHLERMQRYSRLLASKLIGRWDVDLGYVEAIYNASPLHDIGKIGIADRVLLKPGKLTDDERTEMQTHAQIGGEILLSAGVTLLDRSWLAMAHRIASEHHEKVDGSGYPRGLRGRKIALAARIVAIADAYDAIRSKRVYKPPRSHAEAVAAISVDAGCHFDPDLVEVFLEYHEEFKKIANQYKDE